jgi:16S rRNA processing protein RimM
VRLEGVEDRSAAEVLRGAELVLDGGDAPALDEDEWWAHELEGCAVMDGEQLLGTVSRLIELPSCEALEVCPADGGEAVLVPMVKDAIRLVAPAQRRIDVNLDFLGLAGRAGGADA